MSLYNKNIEAFKGFAPDLYKEITEKKAIYDINVEPVPDQYNYLIKYKDIRCFLYSVYNVENQMNKAFRKLNHNAETIVLFGFGLGYEVQYIMKNFKNLKNLIIIEPCLDIFKEAINYYDIVDLVLKINTVSFVLNKEIDVEKGMVSSLLLKFWGSQIEFVYNTSYRTLFGSNYDEILEECLVQIKRKAINVSTTDFMQYKYIYNQFKNLKISSIPAEEIINKLKGVPFIIVSAGPSLNQNMHLLKEVNDSAVICAVGSSIKILEKNNIKPHLRFAFDPSIMEGELFQDLNNDDVGIVYSNSLYYGILPIYKGPKIRMTMDLEPIVRYIYDSAGIQYSQIKSGFSIANVALNLACMCSNKIIMMGQDLCYKNGELYAKGMNVDSMNDIDFNNAGYIKMKDINDEEVYTSPSFIGMRDIFETIIETHSDIKFINATEGGINIKGAENRKFIDVLKVLDRSINVKSMLDEVYNEWSEENAKYDLDKINKKVLDLKEELVKIRNINNERISWIKKLSKDISKGKYNKNIFISNVNYLKSYEKQLENISFYMYISEMGLKNIYDSIEMKNSYHYTDVDERIKATINIDSSKATVLYQYINFLDEMVDEFLK